MEPFCNFSERKRPRQGELGRGLKIELTVRVVFEATRGILLLVIVL